MAQEMDRGSVSAEEFEKVAPFLPGPLDEGGGAESIFEKHKPAEGKPYEKKDPEKGA
jgi:hypothetical protein